MTPFRSGFLLLAGLCALALLSGCESAPPSPPTVKGDYEPAPLIPVPSGFLATDYPALKVWMEERFEVEYRNLTPETIFDQKPISDIKYATSALPVGAPLFHLKSSNLSRREILYKVATFWNLDMTIEDDANGIPSSVKVTGR
jgi:hypothetical protein